MSGLGTGSPIKKYRENEQMSLRKKNWRRRKNRVGHILRDDDMLSNILEVKMDGKLGRSRIGMV